MDPTLNFILQAGLAIFMAVFGFILNGMRQSMEQFRADLKILNDAVLGKYVTREDSERWREAHINETSRKWDAQRLIDNDLREIIQDIQLAAATSNAASEARERASELAITTAKTAADAATAAAKAAVEAATLATKASGRNA